MQETKPYANMCDYCVIVDQIPSHREGGLSPTVGRIWKEDDDAVSKVCDRRRRHFHTINIASAIGCDAQKLTFKIILT